MIETILNKINDYDEICIYRHVNPDFDAFGSQFGMMELIRSTFPGKNVYLDGMMNSSLLDIFEFNEELMQPSFSKKTLAIVLDTANHERIDGETFKQCEEVIKIDHHIVIDSYGTINYEIPEASSCSEIVALFLENERVSISQYGANCLYMGIIGDSNRFMYAGTTPNTFKAASLLMKQGINIQNLYERMYMKEAYELKVQGHILSNYKNDGAVAYYVLRNDDLKSLGITRERGSDFVNVLSSVKEYEIWMAVTENVQDHNWRVSIRSRHVPVNVVANKYGGGGHAFASGATLKSENELQNIIEDLKGAIYEYNISKNN